MIKQDFIETTIEGSKSYVLTEFEFIVKGLVERGFNISSIEKCVNRGIELGKAEKKAKDELIDTEWVDDLLKIIAGSISKIRDDIEED